VCYTDTINGLPLTRAPNLAVVPRSFDGKHLAERAVHLELLLNQVLEDNKDIEKLAPLLAFLEVRAQPLPCIHHP
jgi:hypothetical protein